MLCRNCGYKNVEDANYCFNCGSKLDIKPSLKKIQMTCKKCNGTMTIDADRSIMVCPYCGSSELLLENAAVSIERIRSNAYKEIEHERIKAMKDIEELKIRYARDKEWKENYTAHSADTLLRSIKQIEEEKSGLWNKLTKGNVKIERDKALRKADLIANFTLYDSANDLFDVFYLADSKINVWYSKHSFFNRIRKSDKDNLTNDELISDAWTDLYRRAFQMIRANHMGDMRFLAASLVYDKKMRKLKLD